MNQPKITVCHLKVDDDCTVNPDTGEKEWPHGFTKEEYIHFLLNHNGSMMINVLDMLQDGYPPQEVLGFVSYAMEDAKFQGEVVETTKAGLKGVLDKFDSIDGKSPAAHENENVVDFPGPKGTVH